MLCFSPIWNSFSFSDQALHFIDITALPETDWHIMGIFLMLHADWWMKVA